jgi:hypothetical protein
LIFLIGEKMYFMVTTYTKQEQPFQLQQNWKLFFTTIFIQQVLCSSW